jgi:hypothetical protein
VGLLGFGLWRYQAMTQKRAAITADVSEEELARAEAELNKEVQNP